jgi:hypothetical protein
VNEQQSLVALEVVGFDLLLELAITEDGKGWYFVGESEIHPL